VSDVAASMPSFSGSSVFVTGGTGFVGSHLVEALLKSGATDVRCLVRKDEKWLKGLPVTLIEGTLQDKEALQKGLDGVNYVFHVAALTRSTKWDDFYLANVQGTEVLLELASHQPTIQRAVLVSSLAAIGISSDKIADETTPFAPVSMYGKSKAEMERVVSTFSLPWTIVRPPAVYGPRETDIFTFFKTISSGVCPIVGSATIPALSLVHVSDLVVGMAQAAVHPLSLGKTFFLGGPHQYSWGEIRNAAATALARRVLTIPIPKSVVPMVGAVSEGVGKVFGFYPPLNREKAREIVSATIMCDSSLAASTFNYNPQMDLARGITETIHWYKNAKWLK
jgi:dihydroflavonol-4-reductase